MRNDNRNSQRLNSQVERRYEQAKPHIEEAAKLYNIDQRYLAGLMYLESLGFNSQATSPTGAAGLGQFVRGTWRSVVRSSSHPEMKAIAGLSNNQLDLKRYDPKLNAIATAEYVGAAYQNVKRAFARYGITGEPTAAELYSFHNTGNAAMAIAARKGLTVRQAPIMNLTQKEDAVRNNASLYDRGVDTLAENYMQRVTQKLENGAAYVTASNAFRP